MLGRAMRLIGPWFPEHRIGRENLAAAFPEKSPEEIEAILLGVWDNLGRVAAEFAHIDRMIIHNPDHLNETGDPDATCDDATYARLKMLSTDPKPQLIFAAH